MANQEEIVKLVEYEPATYTDKEGNEKNYIRVVVGDGRKLAVFDEGEIETVKGNIGKEAKVKTAPKIKNGKTYWNLNKVVEVYADAPKTPEKAISAPPAPNGSGKVPAEVWERKDEQMRRMSALRFSGDLFQGSGNSEEAMSIAVIAYDWLTKGGDVETVTKMIDTFADQIKKSIDSAP